MQAEYRTDIARLAEDMAKREVEAAKREVEAAKREVEAAKRDKDNLRWQIGLWVAAVVIIGVMLRWPVLPAVPGS